MHSMEFSTASHSALNERTQHLLRTLVERYIRDGQPVGSRTLARDAGLDLSPATIRNVMADLEELGYLRAPHTSAGRVPTARGYRFFIDALLHLKPLDAQEIEILRRRIGQPVRDGADLARSVSDLLSGFTQLAGVVMLPRRQVATLRQVEFLPLSESRVLVILVLNTQEVQNRIIQTRRPYSASELQQAANYLNAQFTGKDIQQVREALLRDLRETRDNLNRLMQTVVEMAEQTFATEPVGEDYVVAGQTHLMQYADLSDLDKLRQLFEAFNHKGDLLHLFDQCLQADGVQIFIGEESGFEALEECSIVTAPYTVEGQVLGVLGVIGPTRMAYDRVIPLVDVTARLLAAALNSSNEFKQYRP
ncbi:heat-inducible transcriptional repressor HrcA [Candidatus Contendibacter odensensis]|uniref:Heat-inducible transcription repressor HrcA n=1 Tax=Candidatus Contendobacter odensis Run_B_J11 TaxID=1400861 RepID=A0A7U7J486_9GAMM|nr:heat-inducible transcriptional repressor HrcA [Candidatus Contendobacter odensis]CDH45101.1 Heat-inducible transcription repressor HrcA [Candidatus Contendobacter odensis Run_B_J11]